MLSIITPALLAAAAVNLAQAPVPAVPLGDASARDRAAVIAVGDRLPRFDALQPGTRTYLRYRILNGVWRPIDIWRRTVGFDQQDGQRRLHITQSWTGPVGGISNLDIDSWFEAGTFAPISHERRSVRGEEARNEGFLFSSTAVRGLPSTPDNSRAGFTLDTPKRPFNFETDMEMIQTLPLADHYAARLPFYHPGGPPPSDWIVRVTGSARLPFGTGTVDCWIVSLEAAEGPPLVAGRFYVAKQGQQVLRVEQPTPGGGMVVKVLIDSGMPIPS